MPSPYYTQCACICFLVNHLSFKLLLCILSAPHPPFTPPLGKFQLPTYPPNTVPPNCFPNIF